VSEAAIARTRKRLVIVGAASIAVFAIGLLLNALPSEDVHDRYWMLFVAPSMIAFMVGAVAVGSLAWSYRPRRRGPEAGSSAKP
jgi:peptidoglycan/LPS O-acetylase OafA/YrhL